MAAGYSPGLGWRDAGLVKLKRDSAWVQTCQERVSTLREVKMTEEYQPLARKERRVRAIEYDREIAQWKRKLWWAEWADLRATLVGVLVAAPVSLYVIHPWLFNLFNPA